MREEGEKEKDSPFSQRKRRKRDVLPLVYMLFLAPLIALLSMVYSPLIAFLNK